MPGKKGDSKSAAKKGGKGEKEEPEKSKNADKKNPGKGKSGDKADPKKGKDNKKEGKGKKELKKGKDAKKTKKAITSDESEEVSEIEKSVDEIEESEELSEINEEESEVDSDSDMPTPKGKRFAALKDASKAVGGIKHDARKGKKVQSETEETEDNENEDEEDEEEEKPGKQIKLKGASKAVTGFGKKEKKQARKDLHLKGASKVVMGLAGDGKAKRMKKKDDIKAHLKGASKAVGLKAFQGKMEKAGQKKSIKGMKNASRLFIGFGKPRFKPKSSNKHNLKSTSKMFMGFGKKKIPAVKAKKQSVGALKNTSKLMLGFKSSTKKKQAEAAPGGPRKTSFLLIRLGDKAGSTEKPEKAAGKKGLGKLFGFLTKRKNTDAKFKPSAQLLGRMATASNWLTRKFLSRKAKYRMPIMGSVKGVGSTAWFSKIGAQKLPFPSGDEILRHRANMMKNFREPRAWSPEQYGYSNGYDGRGYSNGYDGRGRTYQRMSPQHSWNQGPFPSPGSFQQYDYYDDEIEYYDTPTEQYGNYYEGEEYYDTRTGYDYPEVYGYYEDEMEYYDNHNIPSEEQYDYYEDETEYYDSPYGYPDQYGYHDDEMDYYDSSNGYVPYEQHDCYENEMEYDIPTQYTSPDQYMYYYDGMDYYESPYAEEFGPYSDDPYSSQHFGYGFNYSENEGSPYLESSYNQFGYPMSDIEEQEEMDSESNFQAYSSPWISQQNTAMSFQLPSPPFSLPRQFRLFPRPQVKLFGREKLEVPRLPSPYSASTNFDYPSEEDGFQDHSSAWHAENAEESSSASSSPFLQQYGHNIPPSPQSPIRQFGQPIGLQNRTFPRPSSRRFRSPIPMESPKQPPGMQYDSPPLSPQPSIRHFDRPPSPQLSVKPRSYLCSPQPSIRRLGSLTGKLSPKLSQTPFGLKTPETQRSPSPKSPIKRSSPQPLRRVSLLLSPQPSPGSPVGRREQRSSSPQPSHRRFKPPPSPQLSVGHLGRFPQLPVRMFGQKETPAALAPNTVYPNLFKHFSPPAPVEFRNHPSPKASLRQNSPLSSYQLPLQTFGSSMKRDSQRPPSPPSTLRQHSLPPPRSPFKMSSHKAAISEKPRPISPKPFKHFGQPSNSAPQRPPSPQSSLRQHGQLSSSQSPLKMVPGEQFKKPPSPQPSVKQRPLFPKRAPGMFGIKASETTVPKPASGNPFLRRIGQPKNEPQRPSSPRPSVRRPLSPRLSQSIRESHNTLFRKQSVSQQSLMQGRNPCPDTSNFKHFGSKRVPPESLKTTSRNSFLKRFGHPAVNDQSRQNSSQQPVRPHRPSLDTMETQRPSSPQASLKHARNPVSVRISRKLPTQQAPKPFLQSPFMKRACLPMGSRSVLSSSSDTKEPLTPPSPPSQPGPANPYLKSLGHPMVRESQWLPSPRQSMKQDIETGQHSRSPSPKSSFKKPGQLANVKALQSSLYQQPSFRQNGPPMEQMSSPLASFPKPKFKLFGRKTPQADTTKSTSGKSFLKHFRQPKSGEQQYPPSPRSSVRQKSSPGSLRQTSPQPSIRSGRKPMSVSGSPNTSSPQPSVKQAGTPIGPLHSLSASPQMKLLDRKNTEVQIRRPPSPKPLFKHFGHRTEQSPVLQLSEEEVSETMGRQSPQSGRRLFKVQNYAPAETQTSNQPPGLQLQRPISPKLSGDHSKPMEQHEDEESAMGRYAVVLPRVHSVRYRASPPPRRHHSKYHWSQSDSGRIAGSYSARKGFQHSPVQKVTKLSVYRQENTTGPLVPSPIPKEMHSHEWEEDYDNGKGMPWFNKMYSLGDQPPVQYRKHLEEDGVADMTQLEDLHDGAVLYNLKKRFEQQIIYTYIGSILLSVNPYKMYNIYGTDTVLKYKGKSFAENPPHLFAIANVAYSKMVDAKHNQCIIISGESGSGKTEATKLVLRYLAAVHHKRKDNVTQQILEATPLLESFGNAKTVRNDNSSRFGKYIEIFLQDGVICGAITSQYLLEKSRIVFQAKNERNYHIFYEMLAGLSSQQKQRFYLQEAETYYYLNQGGNCEISGKNDGEDFLRLLSSMEVLSFSPDEQNSIFRILSSVLHLGNVYFEKYETDSQEIASVVSAHEIRVVAELLQISPEGLQKSITYKVTETMREKIFTPLTVESAVDARDAVAKILYSLLFSWLTDRINKLVSPKTESLSIAILDIYGFEDLSVNSFEQLCINYANEYLQYFFNKIIFKLEQEEYIREQIDWKEIIFSDNQTCLDLISQKPHGILRILDDQSCFPQATDHTFLQKCHYHHGNNPLYSKPKTPLPEFTIKHYAGKVTYQVHKFIEKNHDQVRQDVMELFVNSKRKILTSLFSGQTMKIMSTRNNTISRRYQAPTVAAKFQQSLMELAEKMESCNPFFVRCIKPNNKKESELFEVDVVSSQLRYSGVLETIRIRKEGYPVRIKFDNFIKRYKILLGLTNQIKADGENCVTILKQIVPVSKGMYSIGLTKLFLKENLYHILESKRDTLLLIASLTLQRYARGFFARKRYIKLRRTVILLQASARGYITRKKFQKFKESLIKVRSIVLMFANRRRFLRLREQKRERIEMEQTMREVVNVAHLDIPAELASLLQAAAARKENHSDCIIQIETPKVQSEEQLIMALDINNYPFSRFVWAHFKKHLFGMLTTPLDEALTQSEEDLKEDAVLVFKLIMRFMGDPHLNGAQEILFGDYVAQIGLASPSLRDEILAQLANQVWRNANDKNAERGWLLLATCLSCFAPSSKMDKYLLKFVSDYAYNGFKSVCQHKLMQAMRRARYGPEGARSYPPCLLEWTGNKRKGNIALEVSCFDGVSFLCPVNSWTTGEELGQDILRHRGVTEGWHGWSVARKIKGEWAELGGHDYTMDLVSDLELMTDFPRQKSYFIISSEEKARSWKNRNVVFGHGFDSDDDIHSPPVPKAPIFMPNSDRRLSGSVRRDSDASNDHRSQKGLDRYLDSLFDPVLSYENADLERTSLVSARMKGGGKVGTGNGDKTQLSPVRPTEIPGAHQGYDPSQLNAQQQDFINQQAYLLAQQMTLQAMALQQQMTSASPPHPSLNHDPSLNHNPSAAMKATNSTQSAPITAPKPKVAFPHQTNTANEYPAQPLIAHNAAKGKPPINRPSAAQTPKLKVATQDPVRHTTLNSEHFPEPTHNIKDIIKQYEQPATRKKTGPVRKEGGKVFTKKMDPHEEAMSILKGQKMPHVSQKPATASSKEKSSKETVAMVKPVSGVTLKSSTQPVPAVSARHLMFSGASISRELTGEDERIQTQLHGQPCEGYYTYSKMPCDIYIRKEVFYPKDSFHSPVILDLIFRQIVNDTFSETCVRLNKEEQMKMKSLLAENKIQASTLVKDDAVKRKIVMAARETWDVYFCRLFPASGSVGTGVQILGVSHKGISLLKLVRASSPAAENLRVLRSYSYTDILFVTIPSKNMLDFNLINEKLILFSSKAPQVKSMIDYFITELKKDSNYVIAVKSHITNNSSYLRFHKGDIIRLQPMEGLEEDRCYGCIVRKKVMHLEELKKYVPDFGWKFGAFHGRSGLFPLEYVQPVAAPDFIHLSTDKKEEPMDKKGKVAASASAAVAAAVGSTAAAEELDRKTEASPPVSEFVESMPEYILQSNQCSMIEFAKKYFRQPHKLKSEFNKEKSKKGKDPKDPAELVKYTKIPIQESLIEFSNGNMNKLAAEIFVAIMKFMGDYPLKGQTEQDTVYTILKLCGEHEVMKDETYCQIIKQITDNTSSKIDSAQRGWRLLYILTAYYKCSEVLKPFLLKFLESVCRKPGASFQGIAKACDHNLKKTFQFGGRTRFPDGMELKAMVAGRSSKRQVFLLSGNMERHLKIKTCTVVVDVIEDFCSEMGLQYLEAAEEYSLFVIINKGQNVQPLKNKDYILDVAAEMEQVDPNFTFCFRRVLWFHPLKFENELCVTVHYNQIVPDYLKGLLHTLTQDMMSDSQLQQVSKLAALQHRAKDSLYLPTIREVQDYIPSQIYRHQRPQPWLNMVTQNTQHVQALSSHQARAQFIGLVSAFPMFGSSFFYIQSSSNSVIVAPCILAINQNGFNFLNKETHELMVNFPLKEIQSTLTQRSGPSNSYPYVEIKLGDLMSQRITQLQLDQALEMCHVTAMHVESMLLAREKRLTLPPSEITLL